MKDLRLKIIADFVKGGFDKAQAGVAGLTSRFKEFFSLNKIGWGSIAGGAAAAIAGIATAADMLRSKWLGMMSELEQSTVDFDQTNARIFRKMRFMNTEQDKAKLQEDLQNQIRGITLQRDDIKRKDDTAINPWQKSKKIIADFAQKQVNTRLGFGNFTDDELKIKRLEEKLFSLNKSLQIVNGAKVMTFLDQFSEKLASFEDADFLREVGENSPENLVKILEERAGAAKAAMDKAVAALSRQGASEMEADAADKALGAYKEIKDALVAARKALEDFNETNTEGGGRTEQPPAFKPKRGSVADSLTDRYYDNGNDDPYGEGLSGGISKSNVGMTHRRRGRGGLSGNRGKGVSRFHIPAHLEDAIRNRSGGLGGAPLDQDPVLVAMKKAQESRDKQTDLLGKIEKKTGAAP